MLEECLALNPKGCMDIDAYLKRIAYDGPLRPDVATLKALHRAHLRAIPYENLDVQLGRPVPMDAKAAFGKIVTRKRGGWCYEMNGLFAWALQELGFSVTRCTGAVMRESRGDEAIANHLVLKMAVEESVFLADVGFGDGPQDPVLLAAGPFVSQGFDFALSSLHDGWWRLHNNKPENASSFDFTLTPADETLLAQRCLWLQSSPQSPFVQNAVLQRHGDRFVWQLRGRVLRKLTPEGKKDYLIENAPEYLGVLMEIFSINLPEAADLWPKICARHEEMECAAE